MMIPVLSLRLTYALESDLRLPRYAGSLWRSAVGSSLRRHVCVTGAKTCNGCPLLARCAYGFLFNTPQPLRSDDGLARYREVPHPYVLSPHENGRHYSKGDTVAVDAILIGPGYRFLPELLTAARSLRLVRTPARMYNIAMLPLDRVAHGSAKAISAASALDALPQTPEPSEPLESVRINFEHPLRLRRANTYLRPRDFDFAAFFTSLARRVSMLYALSEQKALKADFAGLAQVAREITVSAANLDWIDWHRYSARQHKRIPMGGMTGHIDLSGNLSPLWPWLWTGQWLHAGKGAVMGMGRYHLAPIT